MKVTRKYSAPNTAWISDILIGQCFMYGGLLMMKIHPHASDPQNGVRARAVILKTGEQHAFGTYSTAVEPVEATVSY